MGARPVGVHIAPRNDVQGNGIVQAPFEHRSMAISIGSQCGLCARHASGSGAPRCAGSIFFLLAALTTEGVLAVEQPMQPSAHGFLDGRSLSEVLNGEFGSGADTGTSSDVIGDLGSGDLGSGDYQSLLPPSSPSLPPGGTFKPVVTFEATVSGSATDWDDATKQHALKVAMAAVLGCAADDITLAFRSGSTIISFTVVMPNTAQANAAVSTLASTSEAALSIALGPDVTVESKSTPTVASVAFAAPSPPADLNATFWDMLPNDAVELSSVGTFDRNILWYYVFVNFFYQGTGAHGSLTHTHPHPVAHASTSHSTCSPRSPHIAHRTLLARPACARVPVRHAADELAR